MAAKDTLALGAYAWHDDSPSGFSKLSAEIRYRIYCLTLVTGCLTITDLHPEEWQAEQEAGHATRTSYKTKDHSETVCSYYYSLPDEKRCTLNVWDKEHLKDGKVSYTLLRHFQDPPTVSMLALNRQIRAETIPIFYGRNQIRFFSMSALIPFLKDRSELSLQSMQHVELGFEVADGKDRKSRQGGWARAFTEMSKMKHLNLHKLTIHINDPRAYYAWKLKLNTKLQRWVHEMAKTITNLDMLGVMLDFIDGEDGISPAEGLKDESPTEGLLWAFLAPKMLKKIGNEPHDAHSLLKRRLHDRVYEDFSDVGEPDVY